MANTPGDLNREVKETADILKDAFTSLGAQIEDVFRRATTANDTFNKAVKKDLIGTLNSLARNSQQLLDNEYKLNKGQLASRDITKQIYETTKKQEAVEKSILRATFLSETQKAKLAGETADYFNEQLKTLQDQLEVSTQIEDKLGSLPAVFKSLSKIPGVGGLINTSKATEAMQQAASEGASSMQIFGKGLSGAISKSQLLSASLVYIANQTLIADENTTKLAKSLNQTKTEAAGTQVELTAMAFASGDAYLNTSKLVEATIKLGKNLGIAKVFSADVTIEFARLTERMGLAEESAAGLSKLSIMMGKNAHTVTTEALGTAQALQSQAGIQLDNRQILEETGKVSGQLLANFQASPAKIAAAVTQAKLLGTTLEQSKKQSESLLDFQTSIQNELQAEIITGQQLNLERARAAALMGDQATVMKELASQNMNFTKFSQMNVIAQKDFAAAIGLSADELSNQLATQQFIGKSRAEVAALAGEEVANRLQALSVQERFNASLQKLQDALTPIFTALAFVLDKTVRLLTLDLKGFIGADDLMSGYGQRTLVTPGGAYALNNNDTVIAGTNLFRGNDVYSGPAGALSLGNKDVVDAIANLGNRIDQLSDRPVVARPSEFSTPITIKQLQNVRRSI
jgi:hypothetical protein